MRKTTLTAFILLSGLSFVFAQQDAMYSMYMFNGMAINPAYAGARDRLAVTALYRHQWTGLEGAPKTAVLTAHSPLLNDKIGLGLSIVHDNISIFNYTYITANYAYRIRIKQKAKLCLGLSVSLNSFHARWNDLSLQDINDNAFLSSEDNVIAPNFGAGIFFYMERFYFGVSVPHFLNMSLAQDLKYEGLDSTARQWKHYFYTMGVVFDIAENVKFKPSFLFKHVKNAPFEADLNAGFLFKESFWIGAGYRTGDAVDFMVEYDFAKGIRVGYNYDYTLTELNDYSSGSHEIMVGWEMQRKDTYLTPRRMSYF